MDEFIRLNIAIIPAKDVTEEAIKISQDFGKKFPTGFTLDGKDYIPHITCYSPEFPSENLAPIRKEVEKIAKEIESIQINFSGLTIASHGDTLNIEILIEESKLLYDFHRVIVERLNPFRNGHLRDKYKQPEYINTFPPEKQELMKNIMLKVGYPRVLEAYEPHISITRFDSTVDKDEVKLPKLKHTTMKVEKLGIFTMGEYGTCNKLLYEFRLQGGPDIDLLK